MHFGTCTQSDWEASSEEEEEQPVAVVSPPKKKGTLKAKLAEKAVTKGAQKEDVEYDSDDVLDPAEKARRQKLREVNADLSNAAELLGASALGGSQSFRFFQSKDPVSLSS
jgi:translation initiation factor 3 subunit J